jgi:hypothetical protein
MKVIPLRCTSCGASLEISPDMEQFACGYCGASQTVQRQGGTVSLKPVLDAISKVQSSSDKAAAELALVRLQKELNPLIEQYNAQLEFYNEHQTDFPTGRTLWTIAFFVFGCVLATVPNGAGGALFFFLIAAAIVASIVFTVSQHRKRQAEVWAGLNEISAQRTDLERQIDAAKTIINS